MTKRNCLLFITIFFLMRFSLVKQPMLKQFPQKAISLVQQISHNHIKADYRPDQVSRGEPEHIERRMMRVSAYTSKDKGMNGRGICADGEKAQEGRTIAADPSIPIGTQIYISALGRTYTVDDRGGAISGDKLDLFMESRKDALRFGVQELEVWIKE